MIRLGSDLEFLELEGLEHTPCEGVATAGSVRARVTVQLLSFYGSHSGVWLLGHDLDDFVAQLRKLVDTRKETARLESMDPSEFQLELRPIDRVGHYEASVRLGTYQYSGPTYWQTTLSGGFEIAPDQLPHILLAVEELLAFGRGEA